MTLFLISQKMIRHKFRVKATIERHTVFSGLSHFGWLFWQLTPDMLVPRQWTKCTVKGLGPKVSRGIARRYQPYPCMRAQTDWWLRNLSTLPPDRNWLTRTANRSSDPAEHGSQNERCTNSRRWCSISQTDWGRKENLGSSSQMTKRLRQTIPNLGDYLMCLFWHLLLRPQVSLHPGDRTR